MTAAEWQLAHDKLLVKEKEATGARDALAAERRRQPVVRVDKGYVFEGLDGEASLLDLFEGRRQLIVSMLTTQAEKEVRGLVLLSPAVHPTCLPDPRNYERILHVTTKLDLVLLADLSRPDLLRALPRVSDWPIRRRGLTGHGATHDPRVWRESKLTDYLRQIWLPSLGPRA